MKWAGGIPSHSVVNRDFDGILIHGAIRTNIYQRRSTGGCLSFAVVTTKQDKRRNQQQSASEDLRMFQSAPPPFRAKLTGGLCGTRSDKSSEILARVSWLHSLDAAFPIHSRAFRMRHPA